MTIIRRQARPLPPSVPAHPPVPWVDTAEVAPPLWRRVLSVVELSVLAVILGIAMAVVTAVVLLGGFFLVDYMIS